MIRTRVPVNFPWGLGTKESRTTRLFDGRRLVTFKDSNDKITALENVCPHRGAKLSDGIVKNGCIECPYHGWKFDSDGRLVSVQPPKKFLKIQM